MAISSYEEISLTTHCQSILENLAVAFCGLSKVARRYAGRTMKGANEIGKILKPDIDCDIGN
jgi:hypothetical protein